MLADKKMKAFVPTLDPGKAKIFYTEILGLTFLSGDKYGLEFDAHEHCSRIFASSVYRVGVEY
jgi:hypothetical protein